MIVRKGNKTDLPEVLNLIKELAEYEKEPQEVIVTLKELEHDGFSDKPLFHFFIAENEQEVMGMALYFIKYSTWKGKCIYLDDIVVKEKFRRSGVGTKLFEAVIAESNKLKARRLEWQVLDWNKPAIEFYKKYNATFMNEWLSCRFTQEQLLTLNEKIIQTHESI